MDEDSLAYISNPLNSFALIKRLSYDVTKTVNRIVDTAKQFEKQVELVRLPQIDFEGAVEGLIRLQTMYSLNSEDLAKGIIQDKKYRQDLSADDLFALGSELMKSKRMTSSLSYVNLALGSELMKSKRMTSSLSYLNLALERNQNTKEMSDVTILERILRNQNETGMVKEMVDTIDKILKLHPTRFDLEEIKIDLELSSVFKDKSLKSETVYYDDLPKGYYSAARELKLLMEACDGKLKKSDEELSKLYCRFASTNAFTRLAPFKVEVANINPYIGIYYDVISDNEIKKFVSFSLPALSRATVFNADATISVRKNLIFMS